MTIKNNQHFLNLLVLPGVGTVVAGRSLVGWLQITLSFLGCVIILLGAYPFYEWVEAVTGGGREGGLLLGLLQDPDFANTLAMANLESPAMTQFGIRAMTVIWSGILIVLFAWVWCLFGFIFPSNKEDEVG